MTGERIVAAERYLSALNQALYDEMADDPSVIVIGEDVEQGLRGLTTGLYDRFGSERIRDTPISEQAFTGFATGAALAGLRPVVEYQIPSLVFIAFEQMVNQAHKMRLMSGGQVSVPVTYVIPAAGARTGLAGQHSDNPYSLFTQAGLKTVVPATASDAYGLFRTAIRDNDPVVLLAPAAALGRKESVDRTVPIPFGRGRVHREGEDITVVAIGHLIHDALAVADELSDEGIDVEVFDPRTLLPFDYQGLAKSISKTGRLAIVDDSGPIAGFGAEIAAWVAEECFQDLRSPIRRIARTASVIPFAPELEASILPSQARLRDAIREAVQAIQTT